MPKNAPQADEIGVLEAGVRIPPAERTPLSQRLRARYETGDSIRTLATRHNRSYGFVHRILAEAGTTFRPRGGAH